MLRSMDLGKRLKEVRELRAMSQAELSRQAGVSQATISDLEGGTQQGTKKASDLARALRCHLQWLTTGDGPRDLTGYGGLEARDQDLNVYEASLAASQMEYVDRVSGAHLSAGGGEVLWEFEEIQKSHAFRLDWLQAKGLKPERCKVWIIRGDSMEPKYSDGDWVLINMAQREPAHGKVFALIGEDGLRLKQLRRTETGWAMHSLNPDQSRYPPEPIVADNYAIIGRLRGHGGDDD